MTNHVRTSFGFPAVLLLPSLTLAIASTASGVSITFEAEGTITSLGDPGNLTNGATTWRWRYTFESDAPDQEPGDPTVGRYALGDWEMTLGTLIVLSTGDDIVVRDDFQGSSDGYEVAAGNNLPPGWSAFAPILSLSTSDTSTFDSDVLLLRPPNPQDFDTDFDLAALLGPNVLAVDGTVETITCVDDTCPAPTGACCFPDGSCQEMLEQADCEGQGGTYAGDDVTCIDAMCPQPTGACCFPDGSCQDMLEQADCEGQGGTYAGDDVTCACNCPPPWSPFSEFSGFPDHHVYAVALYEGDIIIGGRFTEVDGVEDTRRIAQWRSVEGWRKMDDGFHGGSVWALLAAPDGDLYAGGSFTSSNCVGDDLDRIARWNGGDQCWRPMSSGFDNTCHSLAWFDDTVVAGGKFTDGIAFWDESTERWEVVGNGFDDMVRALVVHDGTLYAGGFFTRTGHGLEVHRIARWSTSTLDDGEWQPVGPGLDDNVWALASVGPHLVAGGDFTRDADGAFLLNRVASWDGVLWRGYRKNAAPLSATGVNHGVRALVEYHCDLVVAGTFTRAGGRAMGPSIHEGYIARWKGRDVGWRPVGGGVDERVHALANDPLTDPDSLVGGGNFETAGGSDIEHIARYGSTDDCNGNEVLDGCEIASGDAPDCNCNGIPDDCDIACGFSNDVFGSPDGIPDECQPGSNDSRDWDGDGIIDVCENDCNGNGVTDEQDIFDGTSGDANRNGLPDECEEEPECREDLDGNGAVDFGDILLLLGAWGNDGDIEDIDNNGEVNFADLLLILGAWGPCP